MPLLRASSFCRRRRRPQDEQVGTRVVVRLQENNFMQKHQQPLHAACSIYTSASVLWRASLIAGRPAVLTTLTRRRVVVVPLVTTHCDGGGDDDGDGTVWIPPVTACCLGLHSSVEMPFDHDETVSMTGHLSALPVPPVPLNGTVVVRLWGRPVMPETLPATALASPLPLPPVQSLLQEDQIVPVLHGVVSRKNKKRDSIVLFYQIISMPWGVVVGATTRDTAYRVSHKTTFALTPPPRLPPISQTLATLTREQRCPPSAPPHPNLTSIVETLETLAITSAPKVAHVLPVVGSIDEHGARTVLEAAADAVGRPCVWVDGLAAYAYRKQVNVSGGGLVDQLRGLEAAVQMAQKHAPSLLVLSLDDDELRLQQKDVAHDHTSRLIHGLLDHLSEGHSHGIAQKTSPSQVLPRVAPVLVVLLTSPLSTDLLAPFVMHRPLILSLPDELYVRYLLGQHECTTASATVVPLLEGRSVAEIRTILRRVLEKQQSILPNSNHDNDQVLAETCAEFDHARRSTASSTRIPSVHWKDIGGLENVRREILQGLEWPLQHPHLFPDNNDTRRRGLLLYGPPGTGKTLVAKAVATECQLPFVSVKGPECLGSFVGESESQVRAVFAQARQHATPQRPCVLFFDELDSLAPRRGASSSSSNVMDRVAATFLTELDKQHGGTVFLLGATNRPDLLDPALLRPGRLDRLIYLGLSEDPVPVLAAQLGRLRLENNMTGREIAQRAVTALPKQSNAWTGADLSSVVTGALVTATERLCAQADQQALQMQKPVDEVLRTWDPTELEPIVTLQDVCEAATRVVPSVSPAERERYRRYQDEFQTGNTQTCNTKTLVGSSALPQGQA